MINPEVLIVGAGPAGLMMACKLAEWNIAFRIIDKTEDHTRQSRALVVQARSLEIFDQMGIAGKAIKNGKVARAVGTFFNGKKVLRLIVNEMGGTLTRFPFFLMIEQSQTEKILIEFLSEHGYQVERKTELKSFTQNADIFNCVLISSDGIEEIITTRFVIGADGAHSTVREQLNISFGGKTYQESLFVLDCKAEVDIPEDEMYLTFSDTAVGGFFPLTHGRWRILGNIPKDLEGKEDLTFEDIGKDFAKRTRMNVRLYDPQWISAYHSHHRYADTFRKGNGFLIGDAAHIHSPVGAQGMNTGLQDACNLSWKLIMVLKGNAKTGLLDSYTDERITIARNLVRTTDRVFSVVTSRGKIIRIIRLYMIPAVLKVLAPVFKKLNFIQRFAFKGISEIGINYRQSSLSQNASFGSFPHYAPKPGDRLPYLIFKNGNGTDLNIQEKMSGKFFCLLIFSESLPVEMISAVQPFNGIFSIETIPMTARTEILYKKFGIKDKGFYLVRPDGYIACRSQSLEPDRLEYYLKYNLECSPGTSVVK